MVCCPSGLNKYRGSGAPESGVTSTPRVVIGRLGFTFLKCRDWQYKAAIRRVRRGVYICSVILLSYSQLFLYACQIWIGWPDLSISWRVKCTLYISWPTTKCWPLVARPHFLFCLVDSQHASYQFVLFKPDLCRRWTLQNSKQVLLTRAELLLCIIQGVFCDWYPPQKFQVRKS